MAYLDYPGLAYFKSLLDENYLRTNYEGDTVINGNVTFTNPVDASVKNDWLGQQIDKTYLKDVVPDPEGSGALALILGDGSVSHLVTDTTVTQIRSNANELYPILLCYDASAEEDQIAKKVWYGNGVRINPRYGYLYSQKMLTLHPTYNRAAAPTSRIEWTSDFRDSVLNPVGQIFEYIDPVSQGGEHRMELRLYGNPNVAGINTPNVNYETNTVSLGVSATRGDALTFFGYAPSTPIYLEDGSTMRKSLVRGDQYGKDIITRDWLNLNGSITGLVHTYMDETIDGYKTFLKTVTIDSGDDNNKAGLNVQGDVNIDSGDSTKPSNLYVQGNSHIHGNEDIDGNLNVPNGTTTTKELHVTDDATIDDDLHVKGDETVDGNVGIAGVINKIYNNTTKEYVTYITEQPDTRQNVAANLIDTSKGLALYGNGSDKKIGVNAGKSLSFDTNGVLDVDFDQMPTDKFEKLMQQLHLPLYIGEKNGNTTIGTEFYVAPNGVNDTENGRGRSADRPWKTIAYATQTLAKNYNISSKTAHINVAAGTYEDEVSLPLLQRTTGKVIIRPVSASASVTIKFDGVDGCCVSHTGGAWELWNINLRIDIRQASSMSFISAISSSDSTGYVAMYHCPINVVDHTDGNSPTSARIISSSGCIRIYTVDNLNDNSSNVNWTRSGTGVGSFWWLRIENSGLIYMWRTSKEGAKTITVSGSFNAFVYSVNNGFLRYSGTGTGISFRGSCIGKEFTVHSGGSIDCDADSNSAHWFPGNANGTVNTSQASWINPPATYE